MMKLTRYTNFDDLKFNIDSTKKSTNSPTANLEEIEKLADFLRSNLVIKERSTEILVSYGR